LWIFVGMFDRISSTFNTHLFWYIVILNFLLAGIIRFDHQRWFVLLLRIVDDPWARNLPEFHATVWAPPWTVSRAMFLASIFRFDHFLISLNLLLQALLNVFKIELERITSIAKFHLFRSQIPVMLIFLNEIFC
jgi:hypothetical protein